MSSRRKSMFGHVAVGEGCRVVGVISSAAAFWDLREFPCDLVEARLDKIGQPSGWLARCEEIEALGKPVLLTIRLKSEGGLWEGSDEARYPLFERAMRLAAVDVELRSNVASEVAHLAKAKGKSCVLSYHDFQKTPSLDELEAIIAEAEGIGGVTKIAAMAHSVEDAERLKRLVEVPRQQPLCALGMGEAWGHLRVELARLGSCLAYGYLDSSAAPGQTPAADLREALRG